ncbi:MAG: hypothetical protein RH917_16490 [Lacipirellulaceae bacterium]
MLELNVPAEIFDLHVLALFSSKQSRWNEQVTTNIPSLSHSYESWHTSSYPSTGESVDFVTADFAGSADGENKQDRVDISQNEQVRRTMMPLLQLLGSNEFIPAANGDG